MDDFSESGGPTPQNPASPTLLCLVGFMGAGKSSVGRRLAQLLNRPFVDLDDVITARARQTVSQIFTTHGEQEFRRLESEALLATLAAVPQGVIALGGGTFQDERNRAALAQAGAMTILLDVPFAEALRRCQEQEGGAAAQRPLLAAGERDKLQQLYSTRSSSYLQAGLQVETYGRSVEEIAQSIVQSIRKPVTQRLETHSRENDQERQR